MDKVIPIDRPISDEIKKIEDKQKKAGQYIEELRKIHKEHLYIIKNYEGINSYEIEAAKDEIKEIEDAIAEAEENIKIGNLMISEKLERKARLGGEKPKEIKIR